MTDPNKLISVVMNTYNERPRHLLKAIRSYLSQKNANIQLVVSTIDDDPNIDLLKSLPITLVTTLRECHPGKSPEGSYLQITKALQYCIGDYFCFASSNDWAEPDKLSNELSCLLSNNAKICYSSYNLCRDNGQVIDVVHFQNYNYEDHKRTNFVSDCALIEMKLLKEYLPFRSVGNFAFWDLWLRIGKDNYRGDLSTVFFNYNHPTWNYRKSPDSMSRRRIQSNEGRIQYQIDKEMFIKEYHVR